ncbi:hypothetical protein LINPERHAP1_LOCUS44807, partial [Linum perenne]
TRGLRSLRDLTQHLTARADDSHAPPVSAFPKAPLSFKRIRGMSSPGKGQVLARYSPVRHWKWKNHSPSDLHVLSMPPAFILSQDRTLHEILSCITY